MLLYHMCQMGLQLIWIRQEFYNVDPCNIVDSCKTLMLKNERNKHTAHT